MAAHSSILAWEIPWTEDPGRLQITTDVDMFPKDGITKTWTQPSD